MNGEQLALFNVLSAFRQRLAIALLSGVPALEAYNQANPDSPSKGNRAREAVRMARRNPDFMAFMNAVASELVSEALATREEVMQKLTTIMRGNIDDMVTYRTVELGKDVDGKPVMQSVWTFNDSVRESGDNLEAIAELKSSSQGLSIKLHPPLVATAQLIAMNGWTAPAKLDLSSKDGTMTPKPAAILDMSKLSDGALKEIAALYDDDSNS